MIGSKSRLNHGICVSVRRRIDGLMFPKSDVGVYEMIAKRHRAIMLVSVLGLCLHLSCSRRGPRAAAELEFDATGNMVASSGPDGKKTYFHYDSRGLPIEVVSPDGSARYGYDAHGNRIWVRDNAGVTEYYYNAFDRLSAVIWDRGPKRLLAYEYDHVGLPSRISVFNLQPLESVPKFSVQVAKLGTSSPSGSAGWRERERVVLDLAEQLRAVAGGGNAPWLANDISYVRNLRGDLQEIRSEAGTVRFDRSADGSRVERVLPNRVHSFFEYTSSRRLSRLRHADSSGREIASFSYNYDNVGRLQNISGAEQGRPTNTAYLWDARGRLQRMTVGGAEFLYKYDEQARRMAVTSGGKTVTFTFDALGRVLKAKGVALGVTPLGGLSVRRDDNETTTIRYNYQDRPLEITTQSVKLRYAWDGEGNLVSLARNGKTAHCVPAAGTGIRLPFVEFDEESGPEWRQLIGQSVLGRTGAGAARFYLEGASGDASYIVNEQGILIGDPHNHAALPSAPRLLPAKLSAQLPRPRVGARTTSAILLLAQWNPDQQQQPSDTGWDQQLAQAQGWLQGFFHEPTPQELLQTLQAAKAPIDANAQKNWQSGGLWGVASVFEWTGADVLFGLDIALTKFTLARDNYYARLLLKAIFRRIPRRD